ncbi:hypothetical protein B0H67DRAFT_588399 [Lasiosphaeris hirsuta]|uniref:Secreted protein n=1 Tax=Lasiosphaeris hirsuta TaxID=260670 RepID=A0AA40A1V6_9PEZI|nr:hypothetical protein B0H67DRAFT_588399 [Lasiosphaeris hirsuta]
MNAIVLFVVSGLLFDSSLTDASLSPTVALAAAPDHVGETDMRFSSWPLPFASLPSPGQSVAAARRPRGERGEAKASSSLLLFVSVANTPASTHTTRLGHIPHRSLRSEWLPARTPSSAGPSVYWLLATLTSVGNQEKNGGRFFLFADGLVTRGLVGMAWDTPGNFQGGRPLFARVGIEVRSLHL